MNIMQLAVVSDLEWAQEWLGCRPVTFWRKGVLRQGCKKHGPLREGDVWTDTWPCHEATRLAALLAETRADQDARRRAES